MTIEFLDKAWCMQHEIQGLEMALRKLEKVRENPLVNLKSCDVSMDAEDLFKELEKKHLDRLVIDVEARIKQLKSEFEAL